MCYFFSLLMSDHVVPNPGPCLSPTPPDQLGHPFEGGLAVIGERMELREERGERKHVVILRRSRGGREEGLAECTRGGGIGGGAPQRSPAVAARGPVYARHPELLNARWKNEEEEVGKYSRELDERLKGCEAARGRSLERRGEGKAPLRPRYGNLDTTTDGLSYATVARRFPQMGAPERDFSRQQEQVSAHQSRPPRGGDAVFQPEVHTYRPPTPRDVGIDHWWSGMLGGVPPRSTLGQPEKVLAPRTVFQQGHWLEQVLVKWKGLSDADSTWEGRAELAARYPDFNLEDEDFLKEGGADTVQDAVEW